MQVIKTLVLGLSIATTLGCAQAQTAWQVESSPSLTNQQVKLTQTLGMYDPEYQDLALQQATQQCQGAGFEAAAVVNKQQQCEIYSDAGCAKKVLIQSYQCQ